MHHLLSASPFHQDTEDWHLIGHVTDHNSFLRVGGSFLWLIAADSFVSHIDTSFHPCILLSERLNGTMGMHQCYIKALLCL